MKKKFSLFVLLSLGTLLFSCGKAVEDRKMMHERAKVFQDSIANVIRMTLAEAEEPGPMGIPNDTSKKMLNTNQPK